MKRTLGRDDAVVFGFKKEYREFYLPGNRPEIVDVPPVNYIAVRGAGDPNEDGGVYQQAIGVLYAQSLASCQRMGILRRDSG